MQVLKIDNTHRKKSIPTFEAMKPNQFKGLDYAVVRKFKAPVEKFRGVHDFQAWAKCLLKKSYLSDRLSISIRANKERKVAIDKWKKFIDSKENDWLPAKRLLVFASVMKNLKKGNEEVPPVINEKILEESLSSIDAKLAINKELKFDFNKLYKSKLKDYYLNGLSADYTGWVKILPKKLDSENYERNVELLKILSNKNWCTKRGIQAKSHLEKEEMHIYLEKGCPKLGVRIDSNEVREIQGEKNNSVIPINYLNELKRYFDEGNYFLSDDMRFMIEFSQVMD